MDDDESVRNIEAALPLVLDQWETYIRLIEGDLQQLEQSSAESVTGGVGVDPGAGRSAGPDFRSQVDAVRAGVARFREHMRQLDDDEISAGNATDRGGLLLSWVSRLTREMSRSTYLQATIRLGLPRCKAAARPFDEAFRLARINDPLVQEQLERVQELEQFLHSVPLDGDDGRMGLAAALVDFQRAGRLSTLRADLLEANLKHDFDQLSRLEASFEIQRRAVGIAIRRVDMSEEYLSVSVIPGADGAVGPLFGSTIGSNRLAALSDFREAQYDLQSVWLTHYGLQLRLACELGCVTIDDEGNWTIAD
jgi:hypothetical protein